MRELLSCTVFVFFRHCSPRPHQRRVKAGHRKLYWLPQKTSELGRSRAIFIVKNTVSCRLPLFLWHEKVYILIHSTFNHGTATLTLVTTPVFCCVPFILIMKCALVTQFWHHCLPMQNYSMWHQITPRLR